MASGMGELPLTAQELQSWCEGTYTQLTPWEFDAILAASHAYTSEKHHAKDVARPSPIAPKMTDKKRKAVAKSIRNALRD